MRGARTGTKRTGTINRPTDRPTDPETDQPFYLSEFHHDVHERRRVHWAGPLEEELGVLLVDGSVELALYRGQAHLHDRLLLCDDSIGSIEFKLSGHQQKRKTIDWFDCVDCEII